MKRKITINKSNNRIINGKLTIPAKLLQEIGITEYDREVDINVENNKLVVEKVDGNTSKDLLGKICIEVTPEEREYLF